MKQLCTWIVPPLVEFFRNEYNALAKTHGKKAMSAFQTFCTEVPKWNQDIIEVRINAVLDGCRCDYVEELVTATFIAHTKMLTAIRTNGKQKKLQITLPKLDHFLHRVFTECARSLWKAPYLFSTELSSIDRQKNILQAESMCAESMSAAVRSLLPVKNILREYLDDEEEESKGTKENMEELDLVEETEEETPTLPSETVSAIPVVLMTTPLAPEPQTEKSPKSKAPKQSLLLTKMDTPPGPATPVGSDHEVVLPFVQSGITIEKSSDDLPVTESSTDPITQPITNSSTDSSTQPNTDPSTQSSTNSSTQPSTNPSTNSSTESSAVPTHFTIETEPTVHFTPYDTVFQDKTGQSTIEYAPKISVEDKPPSTWGLEDEGPSLSITDAPGTSIGLDDIEDLDAPPKSIITEEPKDIDAPLSTTSDFEELS